MSSGRLGNVKSQIKHRALKSHEAVVMRKVMGLGFGHAQQAGSGNSFCLSPLLGVPENEEGGGSVCIFDFPNPGFRMILQT